MPLTLLFFGLGSIGTRLARLVQSCFSGHRIFAFRSRMNTGNNLGLDEIHRLQDVDKIHADIAFITNPTSLHMETALFAASKGMHLFIEKPLTHSLDHWDELAQMTREKGLQTYVGCNLRFDPILQYSKKVIKADEVLYSHAVCSSYLPFWRPQQDYRNSYSAHGAEGGGVLLDLIHEPDYCRWLFGDVMRMEGHAGKISPLEIDSEDFAEILLHHSTGVVSQIHLDYFGRQGQRYLEIYGRDFFIKADLIARTVFTVNGSEERILSFDTITPDYTYTQELRYFFECIKNHESPMNGLDEHILVLSPLLELKRKIALGA